ncbi:MAG: PorT family protein [Verrucomicrobia bacterium]|nr:PorT family protein [Cytophagales bacterium]
MKTTTLSIIAIVFGSSFCFAQQNNEDKSIGIGLKVGYNFAKVTGAASINAQNTNGFHVGAFYSPGAGRSKGFGYRTEIIYSKQGYDFAKNNTTGTVNLDYILLPQLTTLNITKFVQLQAGVQIAFLINAKADSTTTNGNNTSYGPVADYYNKIDYGFAGGIEIHPFKGLLVGARLNISLADTNKEQPTGTPLPVFIPAISEDKLRNNVLQLFAGYKF